MSQNNQKNSSVARINLGVNSSAFGPNGGPKYVACSGSGLNSAAGINSNDGGSNSGSWATGHVRLVGDPFFGEVSPVRAAMVGQKIGKKSIGPRIKSHGPVGSESGQKIG